MRIQRLVTTIALVAILVAACSSTASPVPSAAPSAGASGAPAATAASAPVTLVLRYCWSGEGEVKAMESVIQAWNSSQPDIQVRGISGSVKAEQVAAAVAGGAPPDMVIFCNNSPVAGFAHDGIILPMKPLLDQIGADTSDIIPASLAWMTYKGELYGLPFGQDTWGFYWNTDAFTEVGLDPTKPPKTLDELWDYAKKLTTYNSDGSIARAGFIPDYPGKNLSELYKLFGCELYDAASAKLTANSPACVAWFDWYKKWHDEYDKKGEMTALVASKGSEDEDLFYTGKVAMGLFGEWLPGAGYAPNFAPNLKYETAGFPTDIPDAYGAGFINGNAFFIPKGSKDPVAAAKFGMYLMTDDPSRTMALQNASVPQLTSLVTDKQLTAIPHFKTFLDIANHPKTWTDPLISVWQQYRDGLESALDSVLSGEKTSQQALDELVASVQPDLDANGP